MDRDLQRRLRGGPRRGGPPCRHSGACGDAEPHQGRKAPRGACREECGARGAVGPLRRSERSAHYRRQARAEPRGLRQPEPRHLRGSRRQRRRRPVVAAEREQARYKAARPERCPCAGQAPRGGQDRHQRQRAEAAAHRGRQPTPPEDRGAGRKRHPRRAPRRASPQEGWGRRGRWQHHRAEGAAQQEAAQEAGRVPAAAPARAPRRGVVVVGHLGLARG
mmetsp:Transcript_8036/g.27334  ORF Transcript_8036/g.27334 Transcript_8036/m.27334 type:complete len:220 (-) Transcript_8036:51-710(-)